MNRYFAYLYDLMERRDFRSKHLAHELMEEFDINEEEADKQVAQWYKEDQPRA